MLTGHPAGCPSRAGPVAPKRTRAPILEFMQEGRSARPRRRDPMPVRPKPVREMLDVLIDLEVETGSIIRRLNEAIVWMEKGPAERFNWRNEPPLEHDPVKRRSIIERRQVESRAASPFHARLSNIRDRLFYEAQDWRSCLHRAQALIPSITPWMDRKDLPEVDRWSANLRSELGVLGGVINPDIVGEIPKVIPETVERLTAAMHAISRRVDDLKKIGPEQPVVPLPPLAAVEALNARPVWYLRQLPDGVTNDVLRILDSDGFIEVRHAYLKNQADYPGDPTPPRTMHGDWISPTSIPSYLGTWDTIFRELAARPDETGPELRVTDRARAELARARVEGRKPLRKNTKRRSRSVRRGAGRRPMTDAAFAKLERQTPPLDKRNAAWVRSDLAASLEEADTGTLTTYRTKGMKNKAGTFGVDPYGRVWRKGTTVGARAWYLKSSLKTTPTAKIAARK